MGIDCVVNVSDILDHYHVLSGREYVSARFVERLRFLEAIERKASKVLVPSLAYKPRDAYLRIVDRAIETHCALPEKRTRPSFPMATPEPLEIPRLTIHDLEFSDDPLVKAFAYALHVWALRYRLYAPWIIEAGLQTLIAWEQPENSVQPYWYYEPPTHIKRAILPKPVFGRIDNGDDVVYRRVWLPPEIVYPPIPRRIDETYEQHEQRERVERKRWLRETGLEPVAWKQAEKDWHYEALALRLIDGETCEAIGIARLADQGNADPSVNDVHNATNNVSKETKRAASLIGIPLPPSFETR
jgi:hypothetical protein